MYGPTPNITTPALKIPLKHTVDSRFSEKVKPEDFGDSKGYMKLNNQGKLPAHPLRHSYFIGGLTSLLSEAETYS